MKNLLQILFLFSAITVIGQRSNTAKVSKTNSVDINRDSTISYEQNTLAKLQHKETISINHYSYGCFSASNSTIVITKESKDFIARLYAVSGNYDFIKRKDENQVNRDSLLKTVILTKKNIEDFVKFENELNQVGLGGCTLTEVYEIKSPYLNINKTDTSCSWFGFTSLRISFFGK